MNKFFLITISFAFIFIFAVNIYAEKQVYEGKVVSLVVETISSGSDAYFYGTVERVARLGLIVQPPIVDMEGNVVEKGTVVMQQGTRYWKDIVIGNKADIVAAKQNLKTATENYERYKRLSPIGATSIQEFQQCEKAYYNALGEYEKSLATLKFNQRVLDTRTQYAPFEGIVSKVLYIMGRAAGNPQTVEVTQLNPIGIKVLMPREQANNINSNTPVTVYCPSTGKEFGVFNGSSVLVEDGIVFVTENFPLGFDINDKTVVAGDCFSAVNFYIGRSYDKSLGVPLKSLYSDGKDYYVWKAENGRFLEPGAGIDSLLKFRKEKVVPGDFERLYAGFGSIRILKDSGDLELNDIVLTRVPKGLEEGQEVRFIPERYVFMPNEVVKVVIGE